MGAKPQILSREASAAMGTRRPPLVLRIGFWISIAIAVAVVLRRLVALAHPSQGGPPQLAGLDQSFGSHATLTLAHIVPALAFVVLTPLAFARRFASARWPERLLFPLGTIVGLTAYAMSRYAIGGWLERSAVLVFNSWYLYSLARAWIGAHCHDAEQKRRWLARAVIVLLGIATTRPVMGVFFATSRLTHLEPRQFFGMAFWIGFSINALIAELWVRHSNPRAPHGDA
jgi:prepilin signal peptidase PulO-like enzyme (type II secretory pathway)